MTSHFIPGLFELHKFVCIIRKIVLTVFLKNQSVEVGVTS